MDVLRQRTVTTQNRQGQSFEDDLALGWAAWTDEPELPKAGLCQEQQLSVKR